MKSSNLRAAGPHRPVAAAIATLIGAAAIAGYSAFYLSSAIYAYTKCNPPPASTTCTGSGFWGFGPTLFFLSDVVGIAVAVLLAIFAFLLMARSEHHRLFGAVIIAASVVSFLAFGGAIIGGAAGIFGGIVAIVYRTPQYRGLVQWVGGPAPSASRAEAAMATESPLLPSPAAAAPLPLPPTLQEPPSSSAVPPRVPAGAELRPTGFVSLSSALGGKPTPAPVATPPAPTPLRSPPSWPSASEPRRPLIPYAGPSGTSPPALPTKPTPGTAARVAPGGPPPPSAPASPPVPEELKTVAPAAVRHAWRCPKCGLTNAPWSRTCTQCKTAAPPQ